MKGECSFFLTSFLCPKGQNWGEGIFLYFLGSTASKCMARANWRKTLSFCTASSPLHHFSGPFPMWFVSFWHWMLSLKRCTVYHFLRCLQYATHGNDRRILLIQTKGIVVEFLEWKKAIQFHLSLRQMFMTVEAPIYFHAFIPPRLCNGNSIS